MYRDKILSLKYRNSQMCWHMDNWKKHLVESEIILTLKTLYTGKKDYLKIQPVITWAYSDKANLNGLL